MIRAGAFPQSGLSDKAQESSLAAGIFILSAGIFVIVAHMYHRGIHATPRPFREQRRYAM